MLRKILRCVVVFALTAALTQLAISAPLIHRAWLRNKVASKVFMVRGVGSPVGGTGFAVEAPSGTSYIVTNRHVCIGILSTSVVRDAVLIVQNDHPVRRRVLDISTTTDLCLIEGLPRVDGLKVGSAPEVGENIWVVGHPALGARTMTTGEIRDIDNIVVEEELFKDVYYTTAIALPGSSGSPSVDKWGRVTGVLFSVNTTLYWANVINIHDLELFLSAW